MSDQAPERETFTEAQTQHAIHQWLEFGENDYRPEKTPGQAGQMGAFSGSGWPARCLRAHLEDLQDGDTSEPAHLTRTFPGGPDSAGLRAAEDWCDEHGFAVAEVSAGRPVAVARKDGVRRPDDGQIRPLGDSFETCPAELILKAEVVPLGEREHFEAVGQPPPMDFAAFAVELWGILDDIDTTTDMVKGDDAAFRARVERLHRRRFQVFVSDGYSLFDPKTKARIEASVTSPDHPKEWKEVAGMAAGGEISAGELCAAYSAKMAEQDLEHLDEDTRPHLRAVELDNRITALEEDRDDHRRRLNDQRWRMRKLEARLEGDGGQADDEITPEDCAEPFDAAVDALFEGLIEGLEEFLGGPGDHTIRDSCNAARMAILGLRR